MALQGFVTKFYHSPRKTNPPNYAEKNKKSKLQMHIYEHVLLMEWGIKARPLNLHAQ
jgi:hypothetical protein